MKNFLKIKDLKNKEIKKVNKERLYIAKNKEKNLKLRLIKEYGQVSD
jgi:hypothetical protein